MGKVSKVLILSGLALLLAAPAAIAEDQRPSGNRLLVDTVADSSGMNNALPRLGQTMDQVRNRHGAPEQQIAAVGQPPISRWVYSDYTIYFERDRVLHTVRQR